MTNCKTAAVVKANGYGLGAANVAKALFKAGVRQFFVAVAEEAVPIREELGPKPEICVFSGHMKGDTDADPRFGPDADAEFGRTDDAAF